MERKSKNGYSNQLIDGDGGWVAWVDMAMWLDGEKRL